jgi:flagellar biosynthesis/type III secretory pathway protein FliH
LTAFDPSSHRSGSLFAEDFDLPEQATDPAPPPPTFGPVELAAARAESWATGHTVGLAEAAADHAIALGRAAHSTAEQIAAVRAEALRQAEVHAEAVARLWLDTLASLFPALCAKHGDAEAQALAKLVLPGLAGEPVITLRADPALAQHLAEEIEALEPNEPGRIRIIPNETAMPGDIRISWNSGLASRDATELWEQVAAVLADAGLSCGELATEMQDAA